MVVVVVVVVVVVMLGVGGHPTRPVMVKEGKKLIFCQRQHGMYEREREREVKDFHQGVPYLSVLSYPY